MNRTLINFLDNINQLLAFGLVVGGAAVAYFYGQADQLDRLGFITPAIFIYPILGAIAGLIVASVICGLLALLIEIERHLREVAKPTSTIATQPAQQPQLP